MKNIHQVLLDNKGGAALAIDKLISGGSQHVFYLLVLKKSYDSQERLEASIKELTRFGISYDVIALVILLNPQGIGEQKKF